MNALDGYDLADAVLTRRTVRRLILFLFVVVSLGIWAGVLSAEQVGMFLYDESRQRADELLEPLLAGMTPTSTDRLHHDDSADRRVRENDGTTTDPSAAPG